jgi:hypothetical protein
VAPRCFVALVARLFLDFGGGYGSAGGVGYTPVIHRITVYNTVDKFLDILSVHIWL